MNLAADHLLLRLGPVNRVLRHAVTRQTCAARRLQRPDARDWCITADHAGALLDAIDRPAGPLPCALELSDAERTSEALLAASGPLPLDTLRARLALTDFELQSLLVCCAPEVDRNYERLFAYIHDDLNSRFPSVGLLSSLGASSPAAMLKRRSALSRWGTLRRCGVLEPLRDSDSELRQELRLAPAALAYLTGSNPRAIESFADLGEIRIPSPLFLTPDSNPERLAAHVAAGARRLGIWGPDETNPFDLVMAVAKETGRMLRRLFTSDLAAVRDCCDAASALNALLCLHTSEPPPADWLAHCPVPLLLYGEHPWRPPEFFRGGGYHEVNLRPLAFAQRVAVWGEIAPDLQRADHERLAGKHRLNGSQLRAVQPISRSALTPAAVDRMCAIVVHQQSGRFTSLLHPRRTLDDLVLPPSLHQQVAEVGSFFFACPRVTDDWGFGKILTGPGGLKVLFTGEPGTGKTLAAEAIANAIGLPLLKADLSRVVSKWVGETEKNLESVFTEAEGSQCVLFFDEADALFGKRGEVRAGADRYANLEVGYLLQRLEAFGGLIILASNLKDHLDQAFLRRFDILLHFPMPGVPERRAIWRHAFQPEAPLDGSVDFDALGKLELSGAAIVSAARTAALIAVDQGSDSISMSHITLAVSRQFGRESRILQPVKPAAHVRTAL